MRLTQKKVEDIIITIIGTEGLILIKQLYGKENISEFDLAKKTKKDIKIVRKMLYLLYNHNLVSFTRKKDKQKGWYIYYWTLIPDNVRFTYFKRRKTLLARLKQKLEEEEKELFFACPKNCVRLNFDHAMDMDFHCPECGELLAQDTSEDKIVHLKKQIILIQDELEKIQKKKKVKKEKTKQRKKVVKKKITTKKKAVKKKRATKKKIVKEGKKVAKKKKPQKKRKVVKKAIKKKASIKKKPIKKVKKKIIKKPKSKTTKKKKK